ncbi:MAG: acylphosphatase [Actinobacteria bacterium]|nr:acylphosphatase [Actinomycetota bacterium]
MHRAIITVDGRVQGVGFRWWAMGEARELGLAGHASNLDDGTVEVDIQGELTKIGAMVRRLIEQPTTTGRPGRVISHTLRWVEPEPGARGFVGY